MTIIRPSGARVFFDNKLVGHAHAAADQAVRLDTEAFYDASKSDLDFAAARSKEMRGEFTMHMDIENQQRLQQFLMYPYQLEAMQRISKLAGRFQPFEFDRPLMYHGDMMRNESDRRFTVVNPSAAGKTEVLMRDLGTYGKLSTYASRLYERNEAWDRRWRTKWSAPDALPQQRNTGIHAIVKHICANWGNYK